MPVRIRDERPGDEPGIHRINTAAFDTAVEARLVDALRRDGVLTLSLVAEDEHGLAGHIAFSPVTVTRADGSTADGIGLAPMAVRPDLQRTGVGTLLVREGLRRLGEAGHRFCVVLGHPEYYPRFGFTPASRYGLSWRSGIPDEAFMALALVEGGLSGVSGVVLYQPQIEDL